MTQSQLQQNMTRLTSLLQDSTTIANVDSVYISVTDHIFLVYIFYKDEYKLSTIVRDQMISLFSLILQLDNLFQSIFYQSPLVRIHHRLLIKPSQP